MFMFDHTYEVKYNQVRDLKTMVGWIRSYLSDRIVSLSEGELVGLKRPYLLLEGGD